jgi:hypothetical protein
MFFCPKYQSTLGAISNRPVHEGESSACNEEVKNFWKISSVAAIQKYLKNQGTTSKFQVPEEWLGTSSTLRTHWH